MGCSLLLYSSLTPLPGQWDCHQSCKYTLGATFVIISQNFLIARHKSFGRATIAHHNIKHVLWRAVATHVAFYSRSGLFKWYLIQRILKKYIFYVIYVFFTFDKCVYINGTVSFALDRKLILLFLLVKS